MKNEKEMKVKEVKTGWFFEINRLENKIKHLETNVRILTVLCDRFAKQNGIKVERFVDGLIVISQI